MERKSLDLSICVHHYTFRAPCPKGQGIFGRTAVHAPPARTPLTSAGHPFVCQGRVHEPLTCRRPPPALAHRRCGAPPDTAAPPTDRSVDRRVLPTARVSRRAYVVPRRAGTPACLFAAAPHEAQHLRVPAIPPLAGGNRRVGRSRCRRRSFVAATGGRPPMASCRGVGAADHARRNHPAAARVGAQLAVSPRRPATPRGAPICQCHHCRGGSSCLDKPTKGRPAADLSAPTHLPQPTPTQPK